MGSMNPRLGYLLAAPRGPVDRAREAYRLTTRNPLSLDRPAPELIHTPHGEDRRPEAFGPGPCPRCGIRAQLGCVHQRPFAAPDGAPARDTREQGLVFGSYSLAEDSAILAGIASGTTYASIARELHRTEGSVASRVRFLSVENRLIELRLEGVSYEAIGAELGRHPDWVHCRLKELVARRIVPVTLLMGPGPQVAAGGRAEGSTP